MVLCCSSVGEPLLSTVLLLLFLLGDSTFPLVFGLACFGGVSTPTTGTCWALELLMLDDAASAAAATFTGGGVGDFDLTTLLQALLPDGDRLE